MFKEGLAAAFAVLALAAPAQAAGLELTTLAELGDRATALGVADFNGDHIDDFAMASDCGVTTLLGTHAPSTGMPPALVRLDGSFGWCASNTGGTLAIGDVNGDRVLDIVAANREDGAFRVYAGRGDGTFGAGTSFALAGRAAQLVTGDLDGDGRADVISQTGTSIGVVLATPAGFAAPVSYGSFHRTTAVAVGHTDADGKLDVVAAVNPTNGSQAVVNFAGTGDGTLAAGRSTLTYGAGSGLFTARLHGGLDRDHVVMTGGELATLVTGADGALAVSRERIDYSFGGGAAADFDGDGDLDVAAASYQTHGGVVVHFNDGTGTFDTQRRYDQPLLPALESVQVADVDGDGHRDVVGVGGTKLYALRNFPSLGPGIAPAGFGNVTVGAQSTPRTVAFHNTGLRPAVVTGISLSERLGRPAFAVTEDGCTGRTLAVDGMCAITVVFKPTATGPFEAHVGVEAGPGAGSSAIIGGTGIVAPADKTAPKPTSKVAKAKLKTVLSRGLKVTVGCDEACTVKGSLRLKGKEVAKGTAKGKTLTLKFTKAAKKSLAKRKSVKLTLRLTATDTAGNARTTTKTVTVRR